MNKLLKKSYFVLIVASIIVLTACTNDNINSKSSRGMIVSVDDSSAKAISIENEEIVNISKNTENNIDIGTKIENTSNFDISKILINYEEYDKNKNIISKSQSFLDITLNPLECANIWFSHVKHCESLKITSYSYTTKDKYINVDLKNGDVSMKKNPIDTEESKDYEVLTIKELEKNDVSSNISSYKIKFKNTSQKDIGNINLKVAEINKEGEYIVTNDIPLYDVLKLKEDMEVDVPVSQYADNIELIGYSYDDIKENYNVKVDLKAHRVEINN